MGWCPVCESQMAARCAWPTCDRLQFSQSCATGRLCARSALLRLHACHAFTHAGGGLQGGDYITDVSAVRELPGSAAGRVVPVCPIAQGQADICLRCDSSCLGMLCHFYGLHAGCHWSLDHAAGRLQASIGCQAPHPTPQQWAVHSQDCGGDLASSGAVRRSGALLKHAASHTCWP